MTLPPWAPWWIGVVGAFVAIIVGKQVFGGLGQNLFNPAMVARVVLLVSFPLEMTQWVVPQPLFFAQTPGLADALTISLQGLATPWDAMSGASILGQVDLALQQGSDLGATMPALFPPLSALFGGIPGSLGETSALLLLLGGLFLLRKGVIDWVIPVAVLLGVALPASLMHLIDPTRFAGPLLHLLAGATLLTAFFIATDPVTSPVSRLGQAVFGAGIGLLIYLIRTFGAYPEGAAFAILLMNAATPMIDHYLKPRIFGRDRRGQPLPVAGDTSAERKR
jgi:electron transport complex protein RnfD